MLLRDPPHPSAIRPSIAFPHRRAHELVHVRPLVERLHDLIVAPPRRPAVAVLAGDRPPRRGAWNVQVFAGLAEPDLLRLQRRSWRAPRRPGGGAEPVRRRGRYQQVNAHGPRSYDLLDAGLRDVEVSRHGHVPLNETGGVRHDPDGPVVWWAGEGAQAIEREVAGLAPGVPVLVLPPAGRVGRALARRLGGRRGITLAPPAADPYPLLEGAAALLAPPGALAIEAYCVGLPVALAVAGPERPRGLAAELAERVPSFSPGASLRVWADAPPPSTDSAWAQNLLYEPRRSRNDAFAASLRERALQMAL